MDVNRLTGGQLGREEKELISVESGPRKWERVRVGRVPNIDAADGISRPE